MNKHTPGPWNDIFNIANGIGIGNGQFRIAEVHNTNDGEEIANAALIAAAPELLLALEALMTQIEVRGFELKSLIPSETRNAARAAVAKARGQA